MQTFQATLQKCKFTSLTETRSDCFIVSLHQKRKLQHNHKRHLLTAPDSSPKRSKPFSLFPRLLLMPSLIHARALTLLRQTKRTARCLIQQRIDLVYLLPMACTLRMRVILASPPIWSLCMKSKHRAYPSNRTFNHPQHRLPRLRQTAIPINLKDQLPSVHDSDPLNGSVEEPEYSWA